jgi:hypothetical protein
MPGVRGTAAVILGNLKPGAAREALEALRNDTAELDLYRRGLMEKKTVGQLAVEALNRL